MWVNINYTWYINIYEYTIHVWPKSSPWWLYSGSEK